MSELRPEENNFLPEENPEEVGYLLHELQNINPSLYLLN